MVLDGYAEGAVGSFQRACDRYPGWRLCTDLGSTWVALRGGAWPLRLSDGTLAGLVGQMERVELCECGELDRP